ncbi:hypothetical protein C8R45DRAFT_233338 [Mycena sanguinolenta]|nr:hypothetical protein C8R45DRAFT_233338 [Mycena sanguinolenta]
MFALRRAPLRLAARMPVLRPPRMYSDHAGQGTSLNTMLNDLSETSDLTLPVDEGDLPELEHSPYDPSYPAAAYAAPTNENYNYPQSQLAEDYDDPKAVPSWRFHCHSTKTNTINTFTNPDGNVVAWFSGGSTGFKKRNRSSYEAGYQCAVRMFEKIEATAAAEENAHPNKKMTIDLFCKGFGQGRDALFKALMTAQGDGVRTRINSVTDRTPLKIGGTRAKKRKRR